MPKTPQSARLVEALKTLRVILAKGPEANFPRGICSMQRALEKDTAEGVEWIEEELLSRAEEAKTAAGAVERIILGGSQDDGFLDFTIAPRRTLQDLQKFLLEQVGQVDRLPEPSILPLLDQWIERMGGQPAKPPDAPVKYLTKWPEILIALGMKNNNEDRGRVKHANSQYNGPIVIPKQGAQPKVNKAKLIEWWNGLEAQWNTGYQRGRDAKPTADAQHPYGRGGTVAPEISGGVKKRRRDRQA